MYTLSLLFLITFHFILGRTQRPSPSPGLTRDFCEYDDRCQPPRRCYYLQEALLLKPDTRCQRFDNVDGCRCVPPSYIHCQASSDCDDGEICARTVLFPFVCTSSVHVNSLKGRVITIEDSSSDPLVPSCAPPSSPAKGRPRNGLVLDRCLPGSCADGLSCVFPRDDGKYQCCGDGDCICHAPDTRPMCQDSGDCNDGEVCAFGPTLPQQCYGRKWMRTNQPKLFKSLTTLNAPTRKPDSTDSPSSPGSSGGNKTDTPAPGESPAPTEDTEAADGESEEPICVDADALSHLSANQLVFSTHRLARVLCDLNGSCATPGHIVKFKGTAMMMKSYCLITGCVKKVMRVNSARYRRAFLIRSKTEKLEYTAFAARYATRAEEGVLVTAIRLGL